MPFYKDTTRILQFCLALADRTISLILDTSLWEDSVELSQLLECGYRLG